MFELQTIALLVCSIVVLTSSLTSTVNDGSSKETGQRFDDRTNLHSMSIPIVPSAKNISNNNTHPAAKTIVDILAHPAKPTNASTVVSVTPRAATVVADGIELTPDDLIKPIPDAQLSKTKKTSVVARKGAIPTSKISPRKGVGLESSAPMRSSLENIDEAPHPVETTSNASRTKDAPSTTKIDMKNNTNAATSVSKLSSTQVASPSSIINHNKTVETNSTTSSTPNNFVHDVVGKIVDSSSTSQSTTTKRFKPKPTVTIGETDVDKPIPASPTKTPPLGMPRKIDYIVPVIITIMALPLLGGAAFLLWRRGRDCWDKRHYRRMDFLIDGMYNDHSWK